jgi:hypothetical protein
MMFGQDETKPNPSTENLMNAPTSAEKSLPVGSDAEAEVGNLVQQKIPKSPSQIEADAERIRSSVSRLTSNSIDGLEGLSSELQQLQGFLKSEVARVQGEIDN